MNLRTYYSEKIVQELDFHLSNNLGAQLAVYSLICPLSSGSKPFHLILGSSNTSDYQISCIDNIALVNLEACDKYHNTTLLWHVTVMYISENFNSNDNCFKHGCVALIFFFKVL